MSINKLDDILAKIQKYHPKYIDLDLQRIATKSLREGLISYDKRKGWRGPLKNKKYSKNWNKNLDHQQSILREPMEKVQQFHF